MKFRKSQHRSYGEVPSRRPHAGPNSSVATTTLRLGHPVTNSRQQALRLAELHTPATLFKVGTKGRPSPLELAFNGKSHDKER